MKDKKTIFSLGMTALETVVKIVEINTDIDVLLFRIYPLTNKNFEKKSVVQDWTSLNQIMHHNFSKKEEGIWLQRKEVTLEHLSKLIKNLGDKKNLDVTSKLQLLKAVWQNCSEASLSIMNEKGSPEVVGSLVIIRAWFRSNASTFIHATRDTADTMSSASSSGIVTISSSPSKSIEAFLLPIRPLYQASEVSPEEQVPADVLDPVPPMVIVPSLPTKSPSELGAES